MQRLVSLALVFTIATFAAAQDRRAFADVGMYEKVMDRLLAPSLSTPRDGSLVVLRFSSGASKEFQVAIAETPSESALSVERWRIPDSTSSIWTQLAQRVEANPSLSAEDAARDIHVDRETGTVAASGDLARLVAMHRSLSLPLTGRTQFHLDGGQYLIRIRSVGEDIDLHLNGPADPSESTDPVIRWMGRVRKAFETVPLKPRAPA